MNLKKLFRPKSLAVVGGYWADFVVEGNDQSMHVLNVVSPGFTCALPFSEYVCEKIQGCLGQKPSNSIIGNEL